MMNTPSTPAVALASSVIGDLFTLALVDGLPVESGEGERKKILRYRTARLRETTVADEREAGRMAERVVLVQGQHKLLVSEHDFRYALTLRHIAALECGGEVLPQAVLDLDVLGKLSPHDLGLIEQRVMLLEAAAQVRYGNITQADFEAFAAGQLPQQQQASPQRSGQADGARQHGADAQPGPEVLANFTGSTANSPAHGNAG